MTIEPRSSTEPTVGGPAARRPRARRRGALATLVGAAVLALGLIAPAGAAAATPTTALTDGSGTPCAGGRWPASVQGSPGVRAGAAAGDYLWHDATGWHLRVTHASHSSVVFSGTIRANRPLHVRASALEAEDRYTISGDGQTVTYRFVNHGGLDGLNLTTDCATRLAVSGRLNGSLLPSRRIWLGANGRHPLQNPFVVLRPA
jgi:hypothetical protein